MDPLLISINMKCIIETNDYISGTYLLWWKFVETCGNQGR